MNSVRYLALTLIACSLVVAQEPYSARVIGISDGDTIRVLHDNRQERVRLYGIDCPELGQAFGTKAKNFTGDLVFGKDVTLRVRDHDRWGRIVAEVILPDGRNNRKVLPYDPCLANRVRGRFVHVLRFIVGL